MHMIGLDVDSCFVLRKSISGHIFVGEISSHTSTYVHILQIISSTMPPKCNLEIVCVHICLNEFGFPFVFDSFKSMSPWSERIAV